MKKLTSIALGVTAAALSVGLIAATAAPLFSKNGDLTSAVTPNIVPQIVQNQYSSSENFSDISGRWTITEDSLAGYQIAEIVSGTAMSMTGRTDRVTGTVVIDSSVITEAEVSVDIGSISTDNAERDRFFNDVVLQSQKYPTATFTLVEPVFLSPEEGSVHRVEVTGEVTIHGVKRVETAELEIFFSEENTVEIIGSIPISFSEYNIDFPTTADSSTLELYLYAERQ